MAVKSMSGLSTMNDEQFRLNQDLANQINEMLEGEHCQSDCVKSGRPMLVEALCWCVFGAAAWVLVLQLAN